VANDEAGVDGDDVVLWGLGNDLDELRLSQGEGEGEGEGEGFASLLTQRLKVLRVSSCFRAKADWLRPLV
jgi:hypothetical protein